MATKVRVGIVGAGGVGGLGRRYNSHAGGYTRIDECELVAIADINEERLHQFGDEWEIAPEHPYNTAVEMYEKAGLDVVSVTTHNLYHHQPVIEAAEAGIKVVMVEKPIAISVEWARKMVDACDAAGSRLITEHTRRFLPHYQKMRKIIDDGLIGEVRTIETSGARPLLHNGRTRSTTPSTGPTPSPNWSADSSATSRSPIPAAVGWSSARDASSYS